MELSFSCRRGDGSVEHDRLLSRSSKKSSDPAEIHRQNSTTPGMAKHPPIQTDLLARHVEQLKANSGAKYLLEFEVCPWFFIVNDEEI